LMVVAMHLIRLPADGHLAAERLGQDRLSGPPDAGSGVLDLGTVSSPQGLRRALGD